MLQVLNIPTKINKGTVEIITPVELIKKGDKVGSSEAALLAKLGIRPFSYGLVVISVYENGSVFSPDVLDLTEDDLVEKFAFGVSMLTSLALAIHYPTIAAAPHMVINGYKNALAIAVETDYSFPLADKVKEYLEVGGPFSWLNKLVNMVLTFKVLKFVYIFNVFKNRYLQDPSKFAVAVPAVVEGCSAAPAEEKKEEPDEESDEDMCFSIFD